MGPRKETGLTIGFESRMFELKMLIESWMTELRMLIDSRTMNE